MKYNKVSRRMFLQGAGSTLLSIPFLTSLLPKEAWGAETGPIKRFLNIHTDLNLGHNKVWLPTVNELTKKLPLPGSPHSVGYERLSEFMKDGRPGLSRIINSSMNPFIDKMMIYKALDVISGGTHTAGHQLGATFRDEPKVITLDNFLARNAKFDPSRRPSIALGMDGLCSFDRNAAGVIVPKFPVAYSAINAYNVIFNKGHYPEAGAGGGAHPHAQLLTRVFDDYKRAASGRQIAASDRLLLNNVMDNLSDLQRGLTAQVSASCRHLGQDTNPANNKSIFLMDDALSFSNYVKLIKAIFLCDISRVVTFTTSISNAHDNSGQPTPDYHGGVTHAPYSQKNIDYISSIYSKGMSSFIAPLLQELDACIDPANGRSFLHNGLAQISTETVYPHLNMNTPTMTVGSFNGLLPTGYYVDYGDHKRTFSYGPPNGEPFNNPNDPLFSHDHPGVPFNRFIVTLLQSLGFADSEYAQPELNARALKRSDSLYGSQNNGINYVGGYGRVWLEDKPDADFWHGWRLSLYNLHYFKDALPLPPKV